jgi:serine/threonine protein kinase
MHQLVPLFEGAVLGGRYELRRYCGGGAFGLVFEAYDRTSLTRVAVKVLAPTNSPSVLDDFITEDEILSRLSTRSHVVRRLDSDEADMTIPTLAGGSAALAVKYIVLEYAEGSLADVVHNRADVALSERLQMFRDFSKGVHQCHLSQVLIRDIKAENGLLVATADGIVAKVADFGRSRHMPSPPRRQVDYEVPRGDRRFQPPELLWHLGRDDAQHWLQVDLYMLGSILFELVVGQGLTLSALPIGVTGIPTTVGGLARDTREAHFRGTIGQLEHDYRAAYQLFDSQVPAMIRQPIGRVLRELTAPDPSRRTSGVHPRTRRASSYTWGLENLLQRTDRIVNLARRGEGTSRLRRNSRRKVS